MIHVSVTAEDIANGIAGNCYQCPIAIALARVTRDTDEEAKVYERDWTLWIGSQGRTMIAPEKVREFVRYFDGQSRDGNGRLDSAAEGYSQPGPFEFELPGYEHPDWQERCYHCEETFDPAELDSEGVCKGCRLDN